MKRTSYWLFDLVQKFRAEKESENKNMHNTIVFVDCNTYTQIKEDFKISENCNPEIYGFRILPAGISGFLFYIGDVMIDPFASYLYKEYKNIEHKIMVDEVYKFLEPELYASGMRTDFNAIIYRMNFFKKQHPKVDDDTLVDMAFNPKLYDDLIHTKK